MHELSLVQSVILIVEKSVPKGFKEKIVSVHLLVGTLSGVEITALKSAYSILKDDTLLNEADLIIEEKEGKAECLSCKNKFSIRNFGDICPNCGSYEMKILEGKEFRVLRFVTE